MTATWIIKKSRSIFSWGQWWAVCISSNGRKLAHTETYHNREDCVRAVEGSQKADIEVEK